MMWTRPLITSPFSDVSHNRKGGAIKDLILITGRMIFQLFNLDRFHCMSNYVGICNRLFHGL